MPSAYQSYLEHQKQANVANFVAGAAQGAGLPLAAWSLAEMAGKGLSSAGKKLPSLVGSRPGGIRDAVSKSFDAVGKKVENFGTSLGNMTHKIMNAGPGIEYDSKKLTPMLFDHREGTSKLTVQRGLYWAGNAAAAGGILGSTASAIAPTPPNAMKVAHEDFAALVAHMENNA